MHITAVSRDKKDDFKKEGFLINEFCDIRTGLFDLECKRGVCLLADENPTRRESEYIFSYEGKQIKVKHSDFWNIII